MTIAERIQSKSVPEPNSGCWLWTGKVGLNGYGYSGRGRPTSYAHRLSYMTFRGPIAPGLSVCHRCDVRSCVNPDHLWLGTIAANNADMREKGRARGPSMRGERHPRARFSWEQIREIRRLYAGPHPRRRVSIPGKFSQPELARMFDTTQAVISGIVTRRQWRE